MQRILTVGEDFGPQAASGALLRKLTDATRS